MSIDVAMAGYAVDYLETADKRATRLKEKVCPACGHRFIPLKGKGGGSRVYCYRPECEIQRERDKKKRYRAKKAREQAGEKGG
jgi:hypothetical protein